MPQINCPKLVPNNTGAEHASFLFQKEPLQEGHGDVFLHSLGLYGREGEEAEGIKPSRRSMARLLEW